MFIESLILNIIYLLFPIFCYLIYAIYQNTIGRKENNLFFDLSLFTSIYFILRYGAFNNNLYNIIFLNVILIISFYKRRYIVSIFLSIFLIGYFYEYYDFTLLIIIKYVLLFILSIYNKANKLHLIIRFGIISILFDILLTKNVYVCLYCILFVVVSYIIMILLERSEKLIKINGTIKQLEKEKTLRDSLFKITHEIKNPIAVCKGYLDMLDMNDKSQVNKYIPIIREEINRTLTLMQDFLDLTKLKVEKIELDISLLIEDICSSLSYLININNIKFNYNISCDEVYILGDYDRLKQVFINMIKNSIESIEKDGIINLNAYCNKNYLIVEIEDNGKGMNKETLNRIGESFFSTKKNGTGLGVKLSKEIIEAHDGTIEYKSKEGNGTTVIIKIPKK